MTWHDAVLMKIKELTQGEVGAVFTRQELLMFIPEMLGDSGTEGGMTPDYTVSRVLQELRDEGVIEFVDDEGTYRLL